MDERVARLKTSQDARQLAENASRLGREDVYAQALEKARELQAVEDGFHSPAQIAIASALYAYEEEQSRIKRRTFRANRTRQMLAKHGALRAAERMVLNRQPSKGFEVLEEAGLRELSFEAIIDRFPDEFTSVAVIAARARLSGESPPLQAETKLQPVVEVETDEPRQEYFDAEARSFLTGFRDPANRFMSEWLPRYRESIRTISSTLAAGRPEDLFETFWKTADNGIAHAGQGLLKYSDMDAMRPELVQVIRDIHEDARSENFDQIVERFRGWKAEERIGFVPWLLISRAFAGIHPQHYHTTVDASSQSSILQWFTVHGGFAKPRVSSWGPVAEALVSCLDRTCAFGDDILARNIFPWFVVEQLRARAATATIPPGHTPRPDTAYADLPPTQRTILLRHNALQTALFIHLTEQYGAQAVWTEFPTGTGGYADAIARESHGTCNLYEIKVATTASEVVRQAMGQLLEYGFRKGGLEPGRLFAVGEPVLDDLTQIFIARLNTQFHLNIEYLQITLPEGWPSESTSLNALAATSHPLTPTILWQG
jgi:hypothetical protein